MSALGKIFIVDNDEHITSLLSVNLSSEGYEVVVFEDAVTAGSADLTGVCLIIADAMDMPDTGIDLLNTVKENPLSSHIGFIICTGLDSERLVIDALDAGADDYIVKPFSLRELVARAKAVIRRHAPAAVNSQATTLVFHSLSLDLLTKRVTDGDAVLSLTKTEYAILEVLLKNMNNYVSRYQIYKSVWKDDLEKNNDRIVDTNISRLRKKIGGLSVHLVNRTGLGYMMKS